MKEISLSINGKTISCPEGTSILNVALENGIKIPTLCHHPHLEPVGACRLCIVEDEKSGRIMASCVTPVSPNMAIQTDSPLIKRYRRNIIRLMIANHPESCIVCSQGNRCELRQIAAELGVGQVGLYPMTHYTGLEEANPFITRDLSKCILCGKCIRADHEIVVVGAIDYNLRGFKSRPATVHEMPLEKSSCTFCGTCVSLCPTGALSIKNVAYVGSPQKELSSICGFCGVGCSLIMGSVDNKIVEVTPSHKEDTVNLSTLCVRGHFAHDFLNDSKRLTHPLIRRDGELIPASWDEAAEIIAKKLLAIKKKHGPQSLAFMGSSKCTVEENYLFQKMARVVLETNNVDNGSYGSGRTILHHINEKLGSDSRPMPLNGLEKADVIFVIGADPSQSAPVVSYYIKRASRMNKTPLIVADPRKTELVPFSSLWIPLSPHSDCAMIHALAAILYQRKSYDTNFIQTFTEGFDRYCDSLLSIKSDTVSRLTGLDNEILEKAANSIEGKKIAFVVGYGILQQKYGPLSMDALLNLALMTGSIGSENHGLYFLASENNQIGACDMGVAPDSLPGRQPLSNDTARNYWEQNWGITISPDPGLNITRMIEEAEKGNLQALYIMGENPCRSLPQPERIRNALNKLEFLVVQDILATETTQLADVVLPGAAFSEKGGAFTNMEGRIQSFEPVVSSPGETKPDWEILDMLLDKMRYSIRYASLSEIRAEISQLVPMYSKLKSNKLQSWIKGSSNLKLFHPDAKGEPIHFSPLVFPKDRDFKKDYPFIAIIGSLRYHLGSGTRTSHSNRVNSFNVKGELELSPEDSIKINVKDGDTVQISSPYGSIMRGVTINKDLRSGLVFIPIGFHNNDVMHLINLAQLGEADSPGWKECSVKIEKI